MPSFGYILLFRQLEKWEWYKTDFMVRLLVHLLMKANYKDEKWNGMVIKRGQLVTSRSRLHDETGISDRSLRTCLNRLKSTSEIAIKTTNKYTIITISKYDYYQSLVSDSDQQNDQQFSQQATSNRPEENKYNKLKKIDERYTRVHEKAFEEFFARQIHVEQFCMSEGIDIDTCKRLAREVLNDWALSGETHENVKDARQHMLYIIRIKISIYRKQSNGTKTNQAVSRERGENPFSRAKVHRVELGDKHGS